MSASITVSHEEYIDTYNGPSPREVIKAINQGGSAEFVFRGTHFTRTCFVEPNATETHERGVPISFTLQSTRIERHPYIPNTVTMTGRIHDEHMEYMLVEFDYNMTHMTSCIELESRHSAINSDKHGVVS